MILSNFLFLLSLTVIISTKNTQVAPYRMFDVTEKGGLAPAGVLSENSDEINLLVSKVVDGDTIVLTNGEKVRYIGIDSPEYSKNSDNCFLAAKRKNEQLVLGKIVDLVKDVSERDRYGRLLRYVYVDAVFINEVLVKDGFAQVSTYPPDVKYKDVFLRAEKYARENELGAWGECK